ncbi:MAG: hypothetical protein Q9174_002989 [Haloplaca sp. 1 TL-2023]
MSAMKIQKAEAVLHYLDPVAVLLYFIVSSSIAACSLQKGRKRRGFPSLRISVYAQCLVLASYVAQSICLVVDSLSASPRASTTPANVGSILSSLLWCIVTILLDRTKRPVWYPYIGSWLMALVLENVTFSLFASHHGISNAVDHILLSMHVVRCVTFAFLLAAHTAARITHRWSRSDEETSLLGHKSLAHEVPSAAGDTAGAYGSVTVEPAKDSISVGDEDESDSGDSTQKEAKKKEKILRTRLQADGSWLNYLRGFTAFIPLVWPYKQPKLYFNMIGCGFCIMAGRVLRVLQPNQLRIIVNILTSGSGSLYKAIGLYVFYGWISSNAGIGLLEDCLWLPIEQYSQVSLNTAAYNQIMELSSDFHDNKQSGELYQSIAQGSSVISLLSMVVFQFGPQVLDIVVGYGFLYHLFGPYMALIAMATTITYLSTITYFNTRQSHLRREYQTLARKTTQLMFDTIGSWTTVSYFNRIAYEKERFRSAKTLHVAKEQLYFLISYASYSVGNWTVELGLAAALLLAAYQVSHHARTVGDFVALLSYWPIFAGPLMFFANAQKRIIRCLIDAEQLLQLLQLKPKIMGGTHRMITKEGKVEFLDVHFSYDSVKEIIKGVTFTAEPGQKIALVGETGGGKSTLLKLLFRFYDVGGGAILIDGQNVRDVTTESLRGCIGVVPQDPSMFNVSVMENVRYSRLDATDEEVMEACKAAAVHDKIMTFTNGYASKVGEKGVKLSGGELQRLAIARTILKDPDIILLDEATSNVDTETEARIQTALARLTKGRTTFTVAHRLSTVIDADVVLVVKDGMIIEQGPPQALLESKGKYYDLWCKQVGVFDNGTKKTLQDVRRSSTDEPAQVGSNGRSKVWRPDAPEFIPRSLQAASSSGKQAESPIIKTTSNILSKRSANQPAGGTSSSSKSQGKRQRSRGEATADANMANTTKKPKIEGSRDEESVAGGSDGDGNHKRTRLSRSRRKKMSKSEPTDSSATFVEGTQESNGAPEGSGEAMLDQKRHVSAPVPSASTAENKPPPGRRNRRKNWRLRKDEASHTQSDRSAQNSGTWSAVSGAATPVPPTSTPENDDKGEVRNAGQSKGSVRFAATPGDKRKAQH